MKVLILFLVVVPTFTFARTIYKYPKKDTSYFENGMYFDPYQPFGSKQDVREDPFDRNIEKQSFSKIIPVKYREQKGYDDDYEYDSQSFESDSDSYEDSYSDSYENSYEDFSGFYSDDEDYYEERYEEIKEKNGELAAIADNESRIFGLEKELDNKNAEIASMMKKINKLEHKMSKIEKRVNYQEQYDKNSILSTWKHYSKK